MLTGFEKETAPLSDAEMEFLPYVMAVLKQATGKENAVTNKKICASVHSLSEPRVRKLINHIRNNFLVPCLVATSHGYFIARTEKEMLDYEESLRGRELAIREIRESIEQQRMMHFGDGAQGKLFLP